MANVLETIQLKLSKDDFKIKHNQHAFTNSKPIDSALASITQNWFNNTDNWRDGRMGIYALFIDLRKLSDLLEFLRRRKPIP